jgi:formamidase
VIKGGMKMLPAVGPSPLSVNPIFEIGPAHASTQPLPARNCRPSPVCPPARRGPERRTRAAGPLEPRYSEYLVFEGISVDEQGRQHYLDATLAYKRAVLNCIKYLANFGYTEEQVYLLLSCCPCEGRISGIVDVPNAVATLAVPLAIFDRDVRPKPGAELEALCQGVTVKKFARDVARESDPAAAAKPCDPRLP